MQKGKIQTVLGWVDADALGWTLCHEHVLHHISPRVFRQPPPPRGPPAAAPLALNTLAWVRQHPYSYDANRVYDDAETRVAVERDLTSAFDAGIGTVVDCCSVGIRAPGQSAFLQQLSRRTRLNLIAGTGYYVADSLSDREMALRREEMREQMLNDLLRGVDGESGACAGVIGEIGCSYPLHEAERRSLCASAEVQVETGCPVMVHPGRHKNSPAEALRVFQEAGGKCDRVVMAHLERTLLELDGLLEFAEMGSFLEFDLFGLETSHYQPNMDIDMVSDAQRIARLRQLADSGFTDRIVVSHDIHTKHRLMEYGGHGFSHIPLNIVPKMLQRGFTDDDVKAILIDNPKCWLTFQ